jgi:magnesium transporter
MHVVDGEMQPYFQDVYDHVLRASEWTGSLRDLVTTVRETQLNLQGNRLNTIMKKVTSWAVIIAIPPRSPASTARTCPTPGSSPPRGSGRPPW